LVDQLTNVATQFVAEAIITTGNSITTASRIRTSSTLPFTPGLIHESDSTPVIVPPFARSERPASSIPFTPGPTPTNDLIVSNVLHMRPSSSLPFTPGPFTESNSTPLTVPKCHIRPSSSIPFSPGPTASNGSSITSSSIAIRPSSSMPFTPGPSSAGPAAVPLSTSLSSNIPIVPTIKSTKLPFISGPSICPTVNNSVIHSKMNNATSILTESDLNDPLLYDEDAAVVASALSMEAERNEASKDTHTLEMSKRVMTFLRRRYGLHTHQLKSMSGDGSCIFHAFIYNCKHHGYYPHLLAHPRKMTVTPIIRKLLIQ
jgi:hypothetical protein